MKPSKSNFNNFNSSNQRKPISYNNNYTNNFGNKNNYQAAPKNNNKNLPDFHWDDDPIEIETRDADSIKSDTANNKQKPKLYTFYDYMNKNKQQQSPKSSNDNSNRNSNRVSSNSNYNNNNNYRNVAPKNIEKQTQNNNLEVVPYRNTDYDSPDSDFDSDIPEPIYITMPISSGFGGYTNTTRRKKPEKVLTVSQQRKPVKLQPVYRIESDDELPPNNPRTIVVEDEPDDEIVHVVHRSKPKPKEKIIYVDDDPPTPTERIVYVDRAPTPTKYVYSKPPSSNAQVVYATQQSAMPPTQVIYQQQHTPQVVYTAAPTTRTLPTQQIVYSDPTQVQYVVQSEPQYITQNIAAAQPMTYVSDPNQGGYVYLNEPVSASNLVTTVPSSNIIYR